MYKSSHMMAAMALMMGLWAAGCDRGEPAAKPDANGTSTTNGEASGKTLKFAFVTNQIADFWNIAKVGAMDAQKDLGVMVDVRMPSIATAVEQKRILEDLVTGKIDGIAVSPIDADNQKEFINSLAAKVPLITHDSDAPGTDRQVYIGMNNYLAGRMVGDLVLRALPNGGKVIIFIGRLEQDNSKYRRQGVIDVLLGRDRDIDYYKATPAFDPVEGEIKGDQYTILATIVDGGDADAAKRKAADSINTYPTMNAMIGLFEYNPPACYQALQQAGKLDTIKLIGFDENDITLQAIKDGHCIGTVVQNPYEYGYQSVKVLKAIVEGDKTAIPASKFIDIPPRKITAENVDEYWADLKAKKGG